MSREGSSHCWSDHRHLRMTWRDVGGDCQIFTSNSVGAGLAHRTKSGLFCPDTYRGHFIYFFEEDISRSHIALALFSREKKTHSTCLLSTRMGKKREAHQRPRHHHVVTEHLNTIGDLVCWGEWNSEFRNNLSSTPLQRLCMSSTGIAKLTFFMQVTWFCLTILIYLVWSCTMFSCTELHYCKVVLNAAQYRVPIMIHAHPTAV